MSDETPIIEARGLTKDYGRGRGVFDVSFTVSRGEVFGFLGPNGAGKTVTMRNLMGFIRPQSGEARILGMDCFADRKRIQARLGYLPGEIALMDELSAGAMIDLVASMRGMRDRSRIEELSEMFELDPKLKIRSMSKGNKQKVGIVCAFMDAPDVLLLDEPTSGLDPLMQERFIDLVLSERKRGATVFLSSHIFEEISRTCDRVAFIKQGRIAAIRTLEEVRGTGARALEIAFSSEAERERFLAGHPTAKAGAANGAVLAMDGDIDALVKDLATYSVRDLATRDQTLEEVFLHLYEHGA